MSAALKLYEIAGQYRELEKLADSDDLPAAVIADTLEGLEGDFESKALAVAQFVRSLEANAVAVAEAAKALDQRARRIQSRAEGIKAYLLFHMQAFEVKKIETPGMVLTRKVNPPALLVTDEVAIPAKFWVDPPPLDKRLDKAAVKAAIDSGERVDGAYVEAGERLEIKP